MFYVGLKNSTWNLFHNLCRMMGFVIFMIKSKISFITIDKFPRYPFLVYQFLFCYFYNSEITKR